MSNCQFGKTFNDNTPVGQRLFLIVNVVPKPNTPLPASKYAPY